MYRLEERLEHVTQVGRTRYVLNASKPFWTNDDAIFSTISISKSVEKKRFGGLREPKKELETVIEVRMKVNHPRFEDFIQEMYWRVHMKYDEDTQLLVNLKCFENGLRNFYEYYDNYFDQAQKETEWIRSHGVGIWA